MSIFSIAGSTPSDTGYELKSARFNDDDSAFLSKKYETSGNRRTWTYSCWVKRSEIGQQNDGLLSCDFGVTCGSIGFVGTGGAVLQMTDLTFSGGSYQTRVASTPIYRDPAAWYHIVVKYDTTQPISSDRVKLYVNGEQVDRFSQTTYPAQDYEGNINYGNGSRLTGIGKQTGTNDYYDGYISESYFIDGTAHDANTFGQTDALTGQWKPKDPADIKAAVTFGNNGFYLPFSADELARSFEWTAPGDGNAAGKSVSGAGAGGGGAGSAGGNGTDQGGGNGGNGKLYESFTSYGVSGYFGGGGGGGKSGAPSLGGTGGTGGGGAGSNSGTGTNGTANTGGGGGGAGAGPAAGGLGGDGTVLVKDQNGTFTEFTANGTYTVPGGVTKCEVLVVAGGGGGGSSINTGGGGGGAGGIKHLVDYVVTPAASITVVVGSGGASNSAPNPGWAGDDSSFDGVVAKGGAPGSYGGVGDPGGSAGGPGGQSASTGTVSVYSIEENGHVENIRTPNHEVYPQGKAHIIGPKVGTSSIMFDGTGDYLSVADSADWTIGTGDFTYEGWINTDTESEQVLFSQYESASKRWYVKVDNRNSAGNFAFYHHESTMDIETINGSLPGTIHRWVYIALVRTNGAVKCFIDGVSVGIKQKQLEAADLVDVSAALQIGAYDTTSQVWTGYMDELRISNINRYTQTFTPTENLTVNYLVVAGGGGGGDSGGGGGGGGMRTGTLSVTGSTDYSVMVGSGGTGGRGVNERGNPGGGSVFHNITSNGGGYGAKEAAGGGDGGAGGGAGYSATGGGGNTPSTSPAQGAGGGNGGPSGGGASNSHSSGGGGGGGDSGVAGTAGSNTAPSGTGGSGTASCITGSSVTYAGGGGGGTVYFFFSGGGGNGGGGNAGTAANNNGSPGTDGLGGGGGGASGPGTGATGGKGGDGTVIVSYQSTTQKATGGTVSTYGSGAGQYFVHTFDAASENFDPPTTVASSDANTKLLIHSNTTMGSTTFTDSSSTGHTVTGNGDIVHVAPKIGTGMMVLNPSGTTTDYLNIPDAPAFDFANGKFTMECWFASFGTHTAQAFWGNAGGASDNFDFSFWLQTTGIRAKYGNVTLLDDTSSANYRDDKTWHHVAFVYDVESVTKSTLYVDGAVVATGTTSIGTQIEDNESRIIGQSQDDGGYRYQYEGFLNEFRVSRSVRYTADFTPSTDAFKDDKDTVLLIHGDGGGNITDGVATATGQGTYFWDDSVKAIFYSDGVPTQKSIIDIAGGTNYLTSGANSIGTNDAGFGTGDFSMEMWMNTDLQWDGSDSGLLCNHTSPNGWQWILDGQNSNSTGRYDFWSSDQSEYNSNVFQISPGTWHHLATVRQNDNLYYYIDGNNCGYSAFTEDMTNVTVPWVAFAYSSAGAGAIRSGNFDQIRVSNLCRYPGEFTPATSAFTTDSYTKLLLHMDGTNGGTTFTDSSGSPGPATAFTTTGTWTCPTGVSEIEYIIVGGGGSGGGGSRGDNGGASTASGGGFGNAGGGSGSGGPDYGTGGGGGAGSAGGTGTDSAAGLAGSGKLGFDGYYYAAGGGGGTHTGPAEGAPGGQGGGGGGAADSGSDGPGGTGGRNAGGAGSGTAGGAGGANTGSGGGGGAGNAGSAGGAGGSGIVVIRWPNHTVTVNGDTHTDTAVKKIGTASGQFDGSDELVLADSDDFNFRTDDFTVEMWVRFDDVTTNNQQLLMKRAVTYYGDYVLWWSSSNGLVWTSGSGGSGTDVSQGSTSGWANDTWYHVAIVKTGTSLIGYRDGVAILTTTDTRDYDNTASVYIGSSNGSGYLTGYIDELRISKGVGRYGNFTPPTEPFTSDGDTKFLVQSNSFSGGGLGGDHSGNYNTFLQNNIGPDDSMEDNPDINFATFNPLLSNQNSANYYEGNLRWKTNTSGGQDVNTASTISTSSGKWYCEFYANESSRNSDWIFGIGDNINELNRASSYLGETGNSFGYYPAGQQVYGPLGTTNSYGPTGKGDQDIFQMAVDIDAGKAWWGVNGTWNNSGDPAAGTNSVTITVGLDYAFGVGFATNGSNWVDYIVNFGQDSSFAGTFTSQGNEDGNGIGDFYYAPPSGFLALCASNLPTPGISNPQEHFEGVLYTGSAVERKISSLLFQPDFTWIKTIDLAYNHRGFDVVRGATKELYLNDTDVEVTDAQSLKSFDSDGFTLGTGSGSNPASEPMASWNWKAGGTPVSNTDGTITSSVSANTTAGFSILTFVGNQTSGATVGHGLSVAPDMFWVKGIDLADSWGVYAKPMGNEHGLLLNSDVSQIDSVTYWNDTTPTASVFSLGNDTMINKTGINYIVYCFHSVAGYSKVGSYVGNGDGEGPFEYTGFKPAWVLFKAIDYANQDWRLGGNKMNPGNPTNNMFQINKANAQESGNTVDYLSNGFKIRLGGNGFNNSGSNYVYIAFAESPFKTSNAR